MFSMENIDRIALEDTQREALAHAGVVLAYLHGSVATGSAGVDSDVDIAVLFESTPVDMISATTSVIKALAGFVPDREMDVAILNDASPLLAQAVSVHGQLLYARSSGDRMAFDIRSMHEYESSRRIVRIGQDASLARIAV